MLLCLKVGGRVFRDAQRRALLSCWMAICTASIGQAHEVYLMNSNHTDYNWNATAAQYDAAMLAEMDFYLEQIAATAGSPSEEQARYTPDNWWWLHLYEENRTPAQFAELIAAIQSGHITIPLNPFVTLYGALPTEAVIRAGYYPGRMARQHGIEFLLAEDIENHTNPWGLASIWAGSGVRYTWKGVCACTGQAPDRNDDELFFWQGPDDKTLLFKWYDFLGNNRDWGGYSEARDNLSSPSQIDAEITRSQSRMPGISFTGLFGAGWDNVSWQSTAVVDAVEAFNDTMTGDLAIVSNGVDFFQALEASGETSSLSTLRGGWGNHWDMWPASLAERTARNRRALERLRLAETLAVWAQKHDASFWAPVRASLETGFMSFWKYFEHGWGVAGGGPTLQQMQADKEAWTQDFETAVAGAISSAESTVGGLFSTPDEDRVTVFNPLGFERTDFAQIEVAGGPFVVTDVASGLAVPSQLVTRDGITYLRFLAESVPSLGYHVYRYAPGTPASWPDAATVDPVGRSLESGLYRVVLGSRGEITEATHKIPDPDVQLAGSGGLNDYGRGTIVSVSAENVGPVSATLRVDLTGPSRTVRVTLLRDVDRIEIENAITENETGFQAYGFHANLAGAQIRFEENGAIARPGYVAEGGDFLQGAKADRMALNHFVDFGLSGYHLVVSNWDAFAMRVNDSSLSNFDLTGDEAHVVVMEQSSGAGTSNQGGDDFFLNRFALRGVASAFDGAEAMRTSLAHQNPLHAVVLPRSQSGALTAPTRSLLSVDADNVVVWAFKPAEDPGAGFIVRTWEMGGMATNFGIDASGIQAFEAWETSLVETDVDPATVTSGVISAAALANELTTHRFTVQAQLTLTIGVGGQGAGTVRSTPSGIDCGSDCSEPYDSGTVVTLTATPDPGSIFAGWSGDADCGDAHVTMDANKSCTARFDLAGSCASTETDLCLNEGRFRVEATWEDFEGNVGTARVVQFMSDDSGLLWFFDPDNWEVLVKVLNGCGFNNRFWVFAAATTNVKYLLQVTDTLTGLTKSYVNPLGVSAAAITDTDALAVCDVMPPPLRFGPAESTSELSDLVAELDKQGDCTAGPTHLCLNRNRFRLEVEWGDFDGNIGPGRRVELGSDDSGLFYFFDENNWEMLVKVLDGCGINDRFWVFAAATTNVQYRLKVIDTETEAVEEYFNPLGRSSPAITDADAFATCPSDVTKYEFAAAPD